MRPGILAAGPDPLVALTTDFGEESPYVAAMKGVILSVNPRARLVDLSHGIPPQDIAHAYFFLGAAAPYFPPHTIHVIVIDPGVGTDRAMLLVEVREQMLLVPDNGCWTSLEAGPTSPARVRRLENRSLWRETVSHTFHGRDILAPVAGRLSLGLDATQVGPEVSDWVRWELPRPRPREDGWEGEVIFVDHFGNLITNIPAAEVGRPPGTKLRIKAGKKKSRKVTWTRAYGDSAPGTLAALTSSTGLVEIAVNQGNAADLFGAKTGTRITVHWG